MHSERQLRCRFQRKDLDALIKFDFPAEKHPTKISNQSGSQPSHYKNSGAPENTNRNTLFENKLYKYKSDYNYNSACS